MLQSLLSHSGWDIKIKKGSIWKWQLRDKSAYSLGIPLNHFLLLCSDLLSMICFIKKMLREFPQLEQTFSTEPSDDLMSLCLNCLWGLGLCKSAMHLHHQRYFESLAVPKILFWQQWNQPGCCLGVSGFGGLFRTAEHNDLTSKSSSFQRKFRLT